MTIDHVSWRKSSRCQTNGTCVELGLGGNGMPLVSDSKQRDNRPIIAVDAATLNGFLAAIKAGDYDL